MSPRPPACHLCVYTPRREKSYGGARCKVLAGLDTIQMWVPILAPYLLVLGPGREISVLG